MNDLIKYILTALLVLATQILILNNVNIYGYGTPLLYIWLVIILPKEISPYLTLLVSFLIGGFMDVFCSTPGLHAFATTAAGLASIKTLPLFITNNDNINHNKFVPSIKTMGNNKFFNYTLLIVILHHILLFLMEAFSLEAFGTLLLRMVTSMIFTLILISAIEYYKYKASEKNK